jgi:arylsulfatase
MTMGGILDPKPNILIITFDCLRPDRLSGLGYKGLRTLTFDRLIDEGVIFTNAYCQAPNTWISHGSLFTGCNPYRHGVRTPIRKISDNVQTMAEAFREAGYSTFGLPAMSLLNKEAGFARGFDEYCLDRLQSEEGILSHRYYRSASDTLAITKNWLKRSSRPFFAWVHYFGIHKLEESLLDLPTQYRSQYSDYAQYYDGKVVFADEQFLAPLVAELEALGLFDETILVLWSDHGDDLRTMEHGGSWGHNWALTEDVMRTLLAIRAPWVLPGGEKRDDLAQSVDLFPTLLDLAGLPSSLDQFEGRSLVVSSPQTDPVVYMENLCQGFVGVRRGRFKLVGSVSDAPKQHRQDSSTSTDKSAWHIQLGGIARRLLPAGWGEKGERQSEEEPTEEKPNPLASWWKAKGEPEEILERLLDSGKFELYDLSLDPDEEHNIAAENQRLVSEFKHTLREMATQTVTVQLAYSTGEEEAKVEERLRNLGYF